ncbi:MAG: phage BR0599 family protein [Novosphingobium sp.]
MPLTQYFLKEFSEQMGFPVLLYEFETVIQGPGAGSSSSSNGLEPIRFCNLSREFFWMGNTWFPSEIKNSRIGQSSDINKDGITLVFARTNEFAQQFIGVPPEFITLLTIFRGHLTQSDDEYAVYWKGRLGGAKASENKISINCESVFTSLRRYGLRARYQRTCRHMLYSQGCGLDADDFGTPGIATAATTQSVTSTAFGSQANGFWIGGMLQDSTGALRYIVGHNGNIVTLWRPMQSLIDEIIDFGSAAIIAYPGCDKSFQTCVAKFDNALNFGGMPLLPNKNPLDGRAIV